MPAVVKHSYRNQQNKNSYTTHKIGNLQYMLSVLLSPSSALVLSIFGYYSLAGFSNAFWPEGNLGGIIIRTFVGIIIIVAFLRFGQAMSSTAHIALLPIRLFFILYSLRILENIFLLEINVPPGAVIVLSTFALECIFFSFALSRLQNQMYDSDFTAIVPVLCIMFLLGLSLNLEALFTTAESRMALDKINPISMAQTALGFIIYYALMFHRSRRLAIESAVFVPILIFIMIYARSRGAYIGLCFSLITYFLLAKGNSRIWLATGTLILASGLAFGGAMEQLQIVQDALTRLTSGTDMSTEVHILLRAGAWQQFLDDMLIGRFVVERSIGFSPHSVFFESLMSVGIVGTIPFTAHVILASWSAVRIIRTKGLPVLFVFISVLYFKETVNAASAGAIWGSSGYWITSILVISIWYGYAGTRRDKLRRDANDSTSLH